MQPTKHQEDNSESKQAARVEFNGPGEIADEYPSEVIVPFNFRIFFVGVAVIAVAIPAIFWGYAQEATLKNSLAVLLAVPMALMVALSIIFVPARLRHGLWSFNADGFKPAHGRSSRALPWPLVTKITSNLDVYLHLNDSVREYTAGKPGFRWMKGWARFGHVRIDVRLAKWNSEEIAAAASHFHRIALKQEAVGN